MEMPFLQPIWDNIPVIYQAGNWRNNEKHKGCSNFKISQLIVRKGKLKRSNEVETQSSSRRKSEARLSMPQVNNTGTKKHTHTATPIQPPSLPTAAGYHISPPPQYPKLLMSKFKHIIFHLFMHSAMQILPSKVPLVLYTFCSKHKTHFTPESVCLPELRLEPIQVSSFFLFPLLQSYIAPALVSASETHNSPSQSFFWSSIK